MPTPAPAATLSCRFVARADGTTIPDKWVNQQTFRKLKTLNLANNNFIATLPALNYGSVRSTLNIFRALESLDLSGNKYYGEAPQFACLHLPDAGACCHLSCQGLQACMLGNSVG